MSRIATCPEEHELLVMATGEPTAAELDKHLEVCSDCLNRLARLRAELVALRRDFKGRANSQSTEVAP